MDVIVIGAGAAGLAAAAEFARAAARTGAAAGAVPGGLILKARTVLQQHRRSGSARVRAQRSKCVGVKRFGLM